MYRLYQMLGWLLIGGAVLADRGGWLGARPTRLTVPQSIRDNPGAYRALYQGSPRYFGGK
jgi:hypothetical protein